MMRWMFVILLLGNLLYLGCELDRQHRLDIVNRTVSPVPSGVERLQLLAEADSQSIIAREGVRLEVDDAPGQARSVPISTAITEDSENQLVSNMPDFRSSPAVQTLGRSYCFTFGPIPEENLATGLQDWFKSRGVSNRQRFTDKQGRQLFWVYLAPVASRSGAIETIEDLRSKGTSDYRLITGGNLANAISLGVYSSQASVNDRLDELQEKGYAPVVVPYAAGNRIFWVDVWFGENPVELEPLLNGFPSRYNYVPVDCSKIDMRPLSP